jgi:hypothetical protein
MDAVIGLSFMAAILEIGNHIQRQLFPVLEEEIGTLTDKDRQFVEVMGLVPLGPFLEPYRWGGVGCPPHERAWLVHAFIAKSVYEFPTTRALLDALAARPTLRRLCGWDSTAAVPHESTFSRAFAAFAADELPQKIHAAMVRQHLGHRLVGHVSRDATAIEGCEKPTPKPTPAPAPPRKRGRPAKGETRPPAPPKRLDLQGHRRLAENLADLPSACDVGCKRNSQGHQESWIGYKLHLDTIDGDIPVSPLLTSASAHDSQAAIPLAQMTAQRVTSLYDLMDSAYDAPQIRDFARGLGHVPIIDPNPRGGEVIPLEPAQAQRFKQRSASERVNSLLKERYGGRFVRVRGAKKVMAHLMFGLIALTAMQLYQLIL